MSRTIPSAYDEPEYTQVMEIDLRPEQAIRLADLAANLYEAAGELEEAIRISHILDDGLAFHYLVGVSGDPVGQLIRFVKALEGWHSDMQKVLP